MLFLLGFIFCLIFLKHHLCHFNDHTVTGCRNDVPTKARVSTSFSFPSSLRKSARLRLCVDLSAAYILNAFLAYFQFAFVILARCVSQAIEIFKPTGLYRVSPRGRDILKAFVVAKNFELSTITRDGD